MHTANSNFLKEKTNLKIVAREKPFWYIYTHIMITKFLIMLKFFNLQSNFLLLGRTCKKYTISQLKESLIINIINIY